MDNRRLEKGAAVPNLKQVLLPWLALLLVGVAYYSLFRGNTSFLPAILQWGSLGVTAPAESLSHLSSWLQSLQMALPSFLHAAAFAWLIVSGCQRLNCRWDVLLAVHILLCVVFELTTGTTAITDLLAIVAGSCVAAVLASKYSSSVGLFGYSFRRSACITSHHRTTVHDFAEKYFAKRPMRSIAAAATLTLSTVFTLATAPAGSFDQPVYLSYEELRRSVQVASPRSNIDASRVYLYDNYLILNERNQGLHVIDNSNPEDPVNIGFIEIPGNTEVSIKRGFLYADSYVDLVTLDIRSLQFDDIDRVGEVSRVEGIFPYDEFQNVPDDVRFSEVDPERGVVVDFRSGS